MNLIFIKPRLSLMLVLLASIFSACIPIIRTEYTSPSWQGTLVDMQTGAPLINLEVRDLHTKKKVMTDQQGYFELPPNISEFSFKLPVATMVSHHEIEVMLPAGPLRFTGTRMANTTAPSDFDLGTFPVARVTNSVPFWLQDNGKMVILPEHFIKDCGDPLHNAIHLTNAARLYKKLVKNNQYLGNKKANIQDVELSYYWANESWLDIHNLCFRGDYEQSLAFYQFSKLFYQEAEAYLIDRPMVFFED
ncbi:hypothetical protein [Paraglaciecola sp. L3A3]|uniref:hypothetical protein n=1 Tax=Paraglaciecola sp. L3A3 TaxID=2686358 RepID=UPI00131CDB9D|nr:hypothetical protein [Paraglaciecola sp. L3A3]